MLTQTEKEKIKLEEFYRKEIKDQLEKNKDKKSRWSLIFSFLNSSFGLWLLSSIFLSGGIRLYEDYKTAKEDLKKNQEAIEKLDLEIGYRFSQEIVKLYELYIDSLPSNAAINKNRIVSIEKLALAPSSPKNEGNIFLYVEYSNWGLIALLAEERRILKLLDAKDAESIDQAIAHISGLEVFYEVRKVKLSNPFEVAGAIQEECWLERWKYSRFYFSEGSKSNPFP